MCITEPSNSNSDANWLIFKTLKCWVREKDLEWVRIVCGICQSLEKKKLGSAGCSWGPGPQSYFKTLLFFYFNAISQYYSLLMILAILQQFYNYNLLISMESFLLKCFNFRVLLFNLYKNADIFNHQNPQPWKATDAIKSKIFLLIIL